MLKFRYDTQLLIEGENPDEDYQYPLQKMNHLSRKRTSKQLYQYATTVMLFRFTENCNESSTGYS